MPDISSIGGFELLISRASARGIDFQQVAGEASKLIPACSPRRRKFLEKLCGKDRALYGETVKGAQSRVSKRAYYTHAELGQALSGPPEGPYGRLEGPPYLAAMYSFAMDGSVRVPLYHALRERTAEIARREEWPERIPGVNGKPHHYQDELTAMVLDVDHMREIYRVCPQFYAIQASICLDMPEEIWQSKVMHYFVRIQAAYDGWLGRARAHIERMLFDEFHRNDFVDVATTAVAV